MNHVTSHIDRAGCARLHTHPGRGQNEQLAKQVGTVNVPAPSVKVTTAPADVSSVGFGFGYTVSSVNTAGYVYFLVSLQYSACRPVA